MDFAIPSHLEPLLKAARTLVDELEPVEAELHAGFYATVRAATRCALYPIRMSCLDS